MTDELTELYASDCYRKGHVQGELIGGITALNTLISKHISGGDLIHVDELISLRNKLIDKRNKA